MLLHWGIKLALEFFPPKTQDGIRFIKKAAVKTPLDQ